MIVHKFDGMSIGSAERFPQHKLGLEDRDQTRPPRALRRAGQNR